jgi:hypothetical protein
MDMNCDDPYQLIAGLVTAGRYGERVSKPPIQVDHHAPMGSFLHNGVYLL